MLKPEQVLIQEVRRLVWYRRVKNDPSTEIYLTTMNSLGGRRVMMGLRAGCLPLAVEVER